MKAIIDGGFILACMRKRLDFVAELGERGFSLVVPRESIHELKGMKKDPSASKEDKFIIDRAIEIIEKEKIEKKSVGDQTVRDWLIQMGNEGFYIGSSDAQVKNMVNKKIGIFEKDGSVKIDIY